MILYRENIDGIFYDKGETDRVKIGLREVLVPVFPVQGDWKLDLL